MTATRKICDGPDASEKWPVPLGYALDFIERNLRSKRCMLPTAEPSPCLEIAARVSAKVLLGTPPSRLQPYRLPLTACRHESSARGLRRQIRRRFGPWRAGPRWKPLPNCAGPTLEQQMGSSTLCVAFAFLRYPRLPAYRASRRRRLRRSAGRQRARSARTAAPHALIGVQSDVRVVLGRRPRAQRRRPLRDASPSAPCSS